MDTVQMKKGTAWTIVIATSVLLGLLSMPVGTVTNSFVVAIGVAFILPALIVGLVSRRVHAMGDKRFLLWLAALGCSLVGAAVGYLAVGMVLK